MMWPVATGPELHLPAQEPGRPGNALVLLFAQRDIAPASRETYGNGTTKVTYRDADGNEISPGGRAG